MTQPAKAQEPSMEEILASIRRIIADDDATKAPSPPSPVPPPPPPRAAPPPPPARPAAAAPPPRAAPPPPPPAPPPPPPQIDATLEEFSKPAPGKAGVLDLTEAMTAAPRAEGFRTIDARPDVMFDERASPMGAPDRMLLSNAASAAVDSAFNTLAHTILVQNARTLEDLVREMLRPMLK